MTLVNEGFQSEREARVHQVVEPRLERWGISLERRETFDLKVLEAGLGAGKVHLIVCCARCPA